METYPKAKKEAANFASQFVYEHLKTRGTFYFADNTGYLMLKGQEEKPIHVSSEDPHFIEMLEEYGILPGQTEFIKIGKYITAKVAVNGVHAALRYSSHYNQKTGCFYFVEKDGMLIRGDGEKLERVLNGTDGELFVFREGEERIELGYRESTLC